MSAVEPGSATSGLVERVKAILLKPSPTWDVIDGEAATAQGLFRNYAAILAAIPAVSGLIGAVVFARHGLIGEVVEAVVGYLLSLLMVYVLALIIDALAPSFDGQKNQLQALKVAVYTNTAGWVAGALALIPALTPLVALAGLYGLYLLYLGLPKLMKAPQEKALGYTIVSVIVAIVLWIVAAVVTTTVAGLGVLGGVGAMSAAGALGSNTVTIGDKSVNLAELEAASKKMEAAAKQMENGEGPKAVAPDVLKTFLPEGVAGYARTEVTSSSGGAGGVNGSLAEGVYTKGDAKMRLTVTDLGGAAALAGLANAFNVQSSTEKDGKYEKIGKVEGRMTQESYDSATKHGQYSVLVGERFMVAAEGDGVSIDDLKAATAAVGAAKLEALAKG